MTTHLGPVFGQTWSSRYPKAPIIGTFRIGYATGKSCCSIELYLDTTPHMFSILIVFEVVPVDVPTPGHLDVLDAHQFLVYTLHNKLVYATKRRKRR